TSEICKNRLYPGILRRYLGRWFERGHELSMGEWQKIALARAYLRNGSIMILDEPTAAMDAEAEYQVFEELSRQAANQITLLVSHRFSTVRMADHILVLDEGQVIEYGSHEELVSKNGQYAYLFRLQAQGYQPARSSAD
ncbi:MAG: ATP-binding cassette domain-containing protein, partial [Anaerolineae bacterium]|nr:ATP-binding cassette domain-containing protein [Anaerolineae bacterium]